MKERLNKKTHAHIHTQDNMKLIFSKILVILANHNIKLLLIASVITLKFYEPHHSQHDKNQIDICLNGFSLVVFYKCVCACLASVCVRVFQFYSVFVLFCLVFWCVLEVDINVFVLIYIVLSRIKRIIWITKWNKNDK